MNISHHREVKACLIDGGSSRFRWQMWLALLACVGLSWASGCASMQMDSGPMRPETIHAVTSSNQLLSFNAGRPGEVMNRKAITNLRPGENMLGIDFRPADGKLYALGSTGRLYTIDPSSGMASQVGSGTFALALGGNNFGFDFNPAADRIRVVSDSGQNLRLHPDSGAVVDADAKMDGIQPDGQLTYAAADKHAGSKPIIVAAAYTNSVAGAKATTNFAIDAASGMLVTQGSREGMTPAVSPNSGQLFTVGPLGINTSGMVSFDIAAKSGTAYTSLTPSGATASGFYWIDLQTGKASLIGTVGGGQSITAFAIAP